MDIESIQFTNEDLIELFNCAKAATEKALDPESDLYKWFHDESNIKNAYPQEEKKDD